jgi:hypothetical protein
MKTPASCFAVALAAGAITFTPGFVRAQDFREEGPIEIEKCQTIDKPGSYRLVRNLTFTGSTGACLVIVTDFVSINLAGFNISGRGLLGTLGIVADASVVGRRLLGLTVRNGSISNFNSGMTLEAADGSIVEGLRVIGPGPAGGFGIDAHGIMKGNTVVSVPATGIFGSGLFAGNYVAGGGQGIGADAGSTLIDNTVVNNQLRGIVVDCPSNVTDNTAVNNTGGNLVLNGNGCNDTNNVAP